MNEKRFFFSKGDVIAKETNTAKRADNLSFHSKSYYIC